MAGRYGLGVKKPEENIQSDYAKALRRDGEYPTRVSGHREAIESKFLCFRPSVTKELCDAANPMSKANESVISTTERSRFDYPQGLERMLVSRDGRNLPFPHSLLDCFYCFRLVTFDLRPLTFAFIPITPLLQYSITPLSLLKAKALVILHGLAAVKIQFVEVRS